MSEKTCFIASTIGEKNSPERNMADEKYDLVFEPVLKELNYHVTRADKIGTPGSISYDIVNRLMSSTLVIADVSDENPNVFYELAIRNAIKKPVIVIKGLSQKMPFDIYDKRAISIEMKEARVWIEAKQHLKEQIIESEKEPEQASKSIISEFTFPLDANQILNPNEELSLQLRDMSNEIRRIRNEIHDTKPRSRDDFFKRLMLERNYEGHQDTKVGIFMGIMKSLEGERKIPIKENVLVEAMEGTGEFSRNETRDFIRKMLRVANIYEAKPGHYLPV